MVASAAFYLNKCGNDVTVFEKQNLPGGYMTGGIPEYRIPMKDVMAEIKVIEDSGVKIVCGHYIESTWELDLQLKTVETLERKDH